MGIRILRRWKHESAGDQALHQLAGSGGIPKHQLYVDIKIPGMSAIQQTTKNNLEIRLQLSDCELSVFSAEPINEIEIFSSNGCLIQRNQGENLQTTNIPQLPAGIYLVKVKSEEGYTVTKKILKR